MGRATAAQKAIEKVETSEDYDDEKVTPEQELMYAVGPVVDKLVRGVVLKHEFDGGFQQALASVEDAMKRKGDRELQAGMEFVAGLFAPTKPGRAPGLDALSAARFLDMEAAEKDE